MSAPTPSGLWPITDDVAAGPRPSSVLSIKDMREMTTIRSAAGSRATSHCPQAKPTTSKNTPGRPSFEVQQPSVLCDSWAIRPTLATKLYLRQEAFVSPRVRKLITSASSARSLVTTNDTSARPFPMPLVSKAKQHQQLLGKTRGADKVGNSISEANISSNFHSDKANPHERTYLHDDAYDNKGVTEAKRTQFQLDSFEFFKSRRLTRTILPVSGEESGKTREQCLMEAVKEIKRERIIKQNGPNRLHLNLGPRGTSDHIYIRYAFPYEPFQTPLLRWLRHIVHMQRHPAVEQLRQRYLSTTIPFSSSFSRQEMVSDFRLPSKFETVLNITGEDENGVLHSKGRNSIRNKEWLERFGSKYGHRAIGGPLGGGTPTASPQGVTEPGPPVVAPEMKQPTPPKTLAIAKWAVMAHYERLPKAGPPKSFEEELEMQEKASQRREGRQQISQVEESLVGTDPFIYNLKKIWVKHCDTDRLQGMPYSADNFKRFLTEALYGDVAKLGNQPVADASKTANATYPESPALDLKQTYADEPKFLTSMSSTPFLTALPPPPPWSLEKPLLDPQFCDELFHACNDMSSQRMAFPMAFLYFHLLLIRAVPQVQVDLLRVLMSMSRKRMAMRPLEITAQDFLTIVLLLEQFLENCSTVPASSAHPDSRLYKGYHMKGNLETGIDTSVIHARPKQLEEKPYPLSTSPRMGTAAPSHASSISVAEETVLPTSNVPSPEAVAVLNSYRSDIQYFSDHIPKDNYALHFNEVFKYFPPGSLLVEHMHSNADEILKESLAGEACMLGLLPKYKEMIPSVSSLMPRLEGNHRRGTPRLAVQEALLAEIADVRKSKPRSGTQAVEKSGSQSYLERPPRLV